ncbi:hypothetical protein AOXY_G25893 [Acipenser oxyrinchus oxyrinchus]|uniref:KIAA1522 n=1 Tax=Acipenser oxyrinchus oxyrinchus TaxID=40147 RepID=A0AAD8FWX7_ACIOX|nr:hypothetical protein AOXY_G25893 [Acipenser oxyrinchus oxyrinchus]
MLKHHIRTVYKDDSVLDHSVAPRVSPMQRPKSLAVPGMTTYSYNEPHSPVMSMSPQATYLSKIIPNAILPSSVEVIEINRSKSRNSVRTVSKSSLVSASPGSTRSSLRFYNFNTSDLSSSSSSNWSHSQSSETVVSNSSTLSSGGTKTPNGEDKQRGDGRNASPAPSTGSAVEGSDTMSIQSDMSFNRNLSVTKMKRPPAPPRRTYSLHHKNKQRDLQGKAVTESQENQSPQSLCGRESRDKVLSPNALSETSSVRSDRLAYSADYSSPDVSRCSAAASPLTAEQMEAREALLKEQQASNDVSPQKLPFPGNKFERTMSPSSGYSSQSGTPTFSPKGVISYPSPAGRKKAQPVKPERSCSRSSPAASISSSRTSLSSSVESVPPALAAIEYDEVFVIPPPPKVHAPSPPPPETWMLNKRTFDSLRSSTSQLATSRDVQQQLKKEPALAQKEEAPPVLKTVEPPVQTETLIVKKEVPPVFKKGFKPIQHETQPIVKKEVPPVFKKEYKPACVDSMFIIKKEVLPVFKKQTPPVIKKGVPPEQTETHPILKKETPPIVKKEPPPVQKKETPPIVKKETPPIVKKETPPIVKKETPPIVKKETPPVVKKDTLPIVKKETLPIVKETLPIVKKETPPVFKKETLPIVKSETPLLIKKEVPPVFKETMPVQEIPLVAKKETPPEIKEDVHPVLKNETPPVQRKEVLPEQNVVQDVELIPAVQASPSPPPSPPPAHLPPPPPTKKTPSECSASSPPPLPDPEVCQVLPAAEPLWPPPPPSLEEPVLFFTSQEESDFSFPPPPPPVDHISQTSIETSSTVELPAELAGSEVVPTPPPETSSESTAVLATVVESSETTKPTFQLQRAQEIPAAPPLPTSNDKPKEPVATSGSPSLSITAQPTPQKPPEAPCPPPAPPLVNIKRQQSVINQEVKAKEPLSRTKSTPAPKEEASIPLVTPSLLQMVRLRSVNVGSYQPDEQPKSPVEENKPSPVNGTTPSQTVPQKPVRKSLSFKSPPGTPSALPSMKLQEAIRMKTAAMSSKDMPPHSLSRPNLRASFTPTSPPSSHEHGQTSLRTPEEGGALKSPASTASFIFSRSSKKVVIDTSVSPEAQTDLKRNLVAELMSTSQKKTGKVPPPVAKKPTHIPSSPSPQSPLMKTAGPLKEQHAASPTQGGQGGAESSVAADSTPAPTAGTVQLAGQQAQPKEGIALKSKNLSCIY